MTDWRFQTLPFVFWIWLGTVSRGGITINWRTLGAIVTCFGALVGAASGSTALYRSWHNSISADVTDHNDLAAFHVQVQTLGSQVAELTKELGVIQSQQFTLEEHTKHLSAVDGRMDGFETRLRGDELDIRGAQSDLSNLQRSSGATLPGQLPLRRN